MPFYIHHLRLLLPLTWVSTTIHISATATAKPTFIAKPTVNIWSPASRWTIKYATYSQTDDTNEAAEERRTINTYLIILSDD
jgi:hypothetical protein